MGLLKWNGLLVPLARYAPILCFSWNLSSFNWILNEVLQLFKRFSGCWLVIYNLTFYIWFSFWMSYVCGWVEGDWVGFGWFCFLPIYEEHSIGPLTFFTPLWKMILPFNLLLHCSHLFQKYMSTNCFKYSCWLLKNIIGRTIWDISGW